MENGKSRNFYNIGTYEINNRALHARRFIIYQLITRRYPGIYYPNLLSGKHTFIHLYIYIKYIE
jgi:hypothetical protein